MTQSATGSQPVIELPAFGGVDWSITPDIILLLGSAVVTFVLLAFACRRRSPIPRGYFQNLFDALVEFIEKEVIGSTLDRKAARGWAPFLMTLFFFILFSNLIGMLPLPPYAKAMTSEPSVTLALATIVFTATVVINVRQHGLLGFGKKFIPGGLPKPVAVLVLPIEIISWLAKPVSLAIRLFANMMAGHTLIFIFIQLAVGAAWFLSFIPLVGAIVMSAFELFVCFIQAFIFTMLAGMYIREALDAGH